MSTEQAIWLVGALVAAAILLQMMIGRQSHLTQLLRTATDEQLKWSRQRAKAAKLALETARRKKEQESRYEEFESTVNEESYRPEENSARTAR